MPAARWPRAAGVGLDEAPERAGERRLHEQLTDLGRPAVRIEHRGAAGRIEVELAARLGDGEQAMHVLVHREAVLGVVHGRGEHLAQRPGAVGLEQRQVGVDGAGDREGQVRVGPGPGRDAIEPAAAERRERGQRRRRALATHRVRLAAARVVDERHALAAQRVGRGGLDHGGREAGRHRRVEGVAAREQHAHAGHRRPADGRRRRRPACPTRRDAWSPSPRRGARSRGSARSVGSWGGQGTSFCALWYDRDHVSLDRPAGAQR